MRFWAGLGGFRVEALGLCLDALGLGAKGILGFPGLKV